ncbi:Linear gramicidin dehydrogenase LgrE [Halomicronema hongdechloris C2206]|uniref:Linear gramicidin dehydrogenase LgrE n=2 Tax=Halomicronema hongdechloris TaxID=1209493 RepID=A0A1Z3HL37_9CYAN|nr:Linear gramicidin dehydrogenase LgrE [Halomicronema hongdechloris C2206]
MPMAAPNSWITCPCPNPQATLRLFCFPYAGGGALTFRGWEAHLPATVELCPIELPGRGMRLREPPFDRLAPLAEAIVEALLPCLDKPFAFFGHSMGALLSFEVARRLRRLQRQPGQLFISGRRAPQWPDPDPPIHALPEAEFIAELRRLNGTPAAVLENRELMQLLLPTLRADFAVLETYGYEPAPPLNCPIAAFGGLQDPDVTCEMLEAWRQQTCSGFSLQMLPGDHFFLHAAQPMLGQALHRALASLISL